MAPPPVPMEMKKPVALPLVTTEVKRSSAAVPLMPPPSLPSSQSLLSKGKIPAFVGALKTKPAASLPSIVFPESLTRPTIAPPPIFAPPFKNALLIPRSTSITPKEKLPNAHTLPVTDLKLPNSPPLIAPQIRRPTIIQSVHAPTEAPSQIPGFPLDGKKLKEQQGGEVKSGYLRGEKVLAPLSEAKGASHDQNPPAQNNGVPHVESNEPPAVPKPDYQQKSSVMTQFPLLERMKGKSAEQLKILEENFLRNSFPTHSDVDSLAANTRLSHQEIDSWFAERRALRDNLEQALLNSMGTKRTSAGGIAAIPEKRIHQQPQTLQLNGIHKLNSGVSHLKSPPPLSHTLPIPSSPTSCSVPPDSRSLALLKDDFAQTRWPSPEEFSQLEARTGPPRPDLARWFTDGRPAPQSSGMELTELFHNITTGVNGGHRTPIFSPEYAPCLIQRCQEGGVTNSSKVLEAELGRLMEQRANSQQHDELQHWFTGRLRQQNAADLKNGGQNGGMALAAGAARDVFGSWLEDGHARRRDLLLEREKKMEDASGRLTG
ncbi:hypothetical protein LDENG_00256330 [Lucifuga dentata]|nr:hypothetical protein LDENG_00256330 [Lucifuga dentata]